MRKIKRFDARNSQPYVLIVFVLGLFMIGLIYVLMMKPMEMIYNDYTASETVLQEDVYQNFLNQSRTIFLWAPFVILLGLVIWALIESHRKTDMYGY